MFVLLLVLIVVLFGFGFLNPIWWVAAAVVVFGVTRYGRGGGAGAAAAGPTSLSTRTIGIAGSVRTAGTTAAAVGADHAGTARTGGTASAAGDERVCHALFRSWWSALPSGAGRRDFVPCQESTEPARPPPRLPAPESQSRPAGAASPENAAPVPVLLAFSTRGAPASPPPRRTARGRDGRGPRVLATTAAAEHHRRRPCGPESGVCEPQTGEPHSGSCC